MNQPCIALGFFLIGMAFAIAGLGLAWRTRRRSNQQAKLAGSPKGPTKVIEVHKGDGVPY